MFKLRILSAITMTVLLCVNCVNAQSVSEEDPSVFHLLDVDSLFTGVTNQSATFYRESAILGKVSSIKFNDYIYVAWLGAKGSVNFACIGSSHLKELTSDTIGSGRNVFTGTTDAFPSVRPALSTYAPAMAVLNNKLYVFYNINSNPNFANNTPCYFVIDKPGSVQPSIWSNILLDTNYGPLVDITAASNQGEGTITLIGSTSTSSWSRIRGAQLKVGNDLGILTVAQEFNLPEQCYGRVGICEANVNEYLIAWTGINSGRSLNSAYLNKSSYTYRDKHTYTDHGSSLDGPTLFRKENKEDEDVHILWRGFGGDNQIYQGVFNVNNKNSFSQSPLPSSIVTSNVSPSLVSLNEQITYIFWPDLHSVIRMGRAIDYPYDSWMKVLLKDEHTLKNIVLPGSNNAGMNDVTQASHFPNIYQGLEIPSFGDCNECGFVTQMQDIKDQLESGYRYFGLNLSDYVYTPSQITGNAYFPDGNILHSSVQPVDHFTSTCLGEGFENMLNEARDFLKAHPQELIIINIKDLNPDIFSPNSITTDLEKILPSYKDVLFQKKSYQKNLADIINERIGDFRGKMIITAVDTFIADKLGLLRDVFEVSHDNQYRFINTTNTNLKTLAQNQTNFFQNKPYYGSYKRMDWLVNLTAPKVACDLRPLKTCMESPKPGFWHHVTHVVGCAEDIFEMGYTVFKAYTEPEDPRSWITMAGWVLSISESSSLAHVQKANKLLYPTVYDLERNNVINRNNMVNIIYSDGADYQYTDLCMQLMSDFNDYDELSAHNGHINISHEHISVTCGDSLSGVASIKVSGGHPPYKYYWETTGDSTSSTDSLSEGYHKVHIIDAMGHKVTRKVYVSMSINAHAGLAQKSHAKTEFQPLGLSNHYEADCDNLIAKIESNHSATGVRDSLTAKVWLDNKSNGLYVKRHFELWPHQFAEKATGKITLYFTQNDFDDFNATNTQFKLPKNPNDTKGIANLMFYAKKGRSKDGSGNFDSYETDAEEIFPKQSDVVWNTVGKRWELSFYSEGFGAYFLTAHDATIANDWLFADAYMKDGVPYVNWKVQEKDIDKYYVEYSFDRQKFHHAAVLNSKGMGEHSYETTHANLLLPLEKLGQIILFYRIRQVDNNGQSVFSKIIPLNIGRNNNLYVYPNPFHDQVTVLSNVAMDVNVIDVMGRVSATIHLTKGTNLIPTGTWASGVYILKSSDGEWHRMVKID